MNQDISEVLSRFPKNAAIQEMVFKTLDHIENEALHKRNWRRQKSMSQSYMPQLVRFSDRAMNTLGNIANSRKLSNGRNAVMGRLTCLIILTRFGRMANNERYRDGHGDAYTMLRMQTCET